MADRIRVTVCVTVRRRVAAADLATRQTHPQVHPRVADNEALRAALGLRPDITRRVQVRARW
jgi:hypothetical protein